jgi:hypothetical protein
MQERASIFDIVASRGILYESIFYGLLVFFCMIQIALVGWFTMLKSPHGIVPALLVGLLGWFIRERNLTAANYIMMAFFVILAGLQGFASIFVQAGIISNAIVALLLGYIAYVIFRDSLNAGWILSTIYAVVSSLDFVAYNVAGRLESMLAVEGQAMDVTRVTNPYLVFMAFFVLFNSFIIYKHIKAKNKLAILYYAIPLALFGAIAFLSGPISEMVTGAIIG